MRVFLSPSTQTYNIDSYGTSEKKLMNYIADAIEPYLRASGIPFDRNYSATSVSQSVSQSNAGNYDLHVSLHANAAAGSDSGKARGSRVYYYSGGNNSRRAADIFAENIKSVYPLTGKVQTIPTTELYELNNTRSPAVLHEVAFYDNYEDDTWMHENVQAIARSIANAVADYLGVDFKQVCVSGLVPSKGYNFQSAVYGKVTNVDTVLNLRSSPSMSASVVLRLPPNAELLVLSGAQNGWVKVRYNMKDGYVSADYLSVCQSRSSGGGGTRQGVVSTAGGRLNIRSGPSTSHSVLTQAANGDRLEILGESGAFYRVLYKGVTGYASKNYVR